MLNATVKVHGRLGTSFVGMWLVQGPKLVFCLEILNFPPHKGAPYSYCSGPCMLYFQPWPHCPFKSQMQAILPLRPSLASSSFAEGNSNDLTCFLFLFSAPLIAFCILGTYHPLNWLQNDAQCTDPCFLVDATGVILYVNVLLDHH